MGGVCLTPKDALDCQWNAVVIRYGHALTAKAKTAGVEKFGLENFSSILVWGPRLSPRSPPQAG
jgi:hypothetical protein